MRFVNSENTLFIPPPSDESVIRSELMEPRMVPNVPVKLENIPELEFMYGCACLLKMFCMQNSKFCFGSWPNSFANGMTEGLHLYSGQFSFTFLTLLAALIIAYIIIQNIISKIRKNKAFSGDHNVLTVAHGCIFPNNK